MTFNEDLPLHHPNLLDLPDDLLGHILTSVLELTSCQMHKKFLLSIESTCKRLQQTVACQGLWQAACILQCPSVQDTVKHAAVCSGDLRGSMSVERWTALQKQPAPLFKKLRHYLTMTNFDSTTLLQDVLCASSTGGECNARNILTKYDHVYQDHMVGRPNHWRSSPSQEQGGVESLVLKLACPLSVVRSVKLRVPTRRGPQGLHRPLAVQFHLGLASTAVKSLQPAIGWVDDRGSKAASLIDQLHGKWLHSTPVLPFDQEEQNQVFQIPQTLCPMGLMQVDLLGKGGPASIDGREVEYDVRLVNLKVIGNFIPNMAVCDGRLSFNYHPQASSEYVWKRIREGVGGQAPRFDSSDSDSGSDYDDWHNEEVQEYQDSFV